MKSGKHFDAKYFLRANSFILHLISLYFYKFIYLQCRGEIGRTGILAFPSAVKANYVLPKRDAAGLVACIFLKISTSRPLNTMLENVQFFMFHVTKDY